MIPPWASSSLTGPCSLFLLLAAASWTPQVPAIPGPWIFEPCPLSHTAVEQTHSVPSAWSTLPLHPSPSASEVLPSSSSCFCVKEALQIPSSNGICPPLNPPGTHWACPIFLPSPHLVFQSSGSWFCPSSRWSAYQHRDCA